jgi:hypothetical protein
MDAARCEASEGDSATSRPRSRRHRFEITVLAHNPIELSGIVVPRKCLEANYAATTSTRPSRPWKSLALRVYVSREVAAVRLRSRNVPVAGNKTLGPVVGTCDNLS